MEKKLILILLIILILLGIFMRTNGTLGGYFAFTFDQGRDLLQVEQMIENIDLQLIGPSSGIEGVFHGVWWYWMLIPIYLLSMGDPMRIVLFFNLLMTLCIPIAYLLGVKLFGKKAGLILAAIVAVSHLYISTAAQLWNPNVVPLLSLLFLLSLFRFVTQKCSILWVGFTLGAIFEFHIGFGFMLLASVSASLFIFKYLFQLKNIIFYLTGMLFWIAPRILFDLSHGFLQTKSVFAYLNHPKTIHINIGFIDRMSDRITSLFGIFKESFLSTNDTVLAIVFLIILLVILLETIKDHKSISSHYFGILTLTIALFTLIASVYPDALWEYYFIGVPSLLLPFLGLMLYRVIKLNKYLGAAVTLFIIFRLLSPNFTSITGWEGDASVYKNQIRVVEAIYQDLNQEEFNIAVFTPSRIDYNYQYLFKQYAKTNGLSLPDREHTQSTAYFILEPDPWNKGLRETWINDRIGDGQVKWSRDFSGGIVVEKRVRNM